MTRSGVAILICLAAGGCSPGAFLMAMGNSFNETANRRAHNLLDELRALEHDPSQFAEHAYYGAKRPTFALWGLRGHRARHRLLKLSRHPDPDVAMHACNALPYFGVWAHEAVPRVVDLSARISREPEPDDGWGTLGLGITNSSYMTWSHPVLWVMASHPDPHRRQAATALMGSPGNHSILSVPRLCVSLMDAEPSVRRTATTVLGTYQYRGLPAMPALMLSERFDPNGKVRRGAKYANYKIWKKGV